MLRRFDVAAIQIPIVFNKFGDFDQNGLMYVLAENEQLVRRLVEENPGKPVDLVQPLVIRVNQGDTVEIHFTNKLDFPASINVKGLSYSVLDSDGAFVGDNPNTVAAPGETKVYRWEANIQGAFLFNDLGNPLSSERGSNVHGLFGAIVVEPPGSTWTDPQTGQPLKSGVFADIHNPYLPDYREFVTIFHDESPVKNRFGETPVNPETGAPSATHSINYRSEPMRNRMKLIMDGEVCPDCIGEEIHHDSWVFGDPATPIPRAYRGDPVRWHVLNGGEKESLCQEFVGKFSNNFTSPLFISLVVENINIIPYLVIC
ncbi:multicopper oxidase domain-containing protein [Caldanaerobius polysaccharolyticus]|uniref:multicopper oxidase domain-containing protein n=1 Tax=Caldanaerobius polysaccharolyticus TaxID=44256 RepID=UPI00047D91DC|nr:multicopper oxidase domain-containing protein [Caldanaerobius polysaccharolyticus]